MRPLVVAHRGASSLAPENTLEAFAKAIEVGADMVEFDVRATSDGALVAFHDEAVGGRPLRACTYGALCGILGFEPPRLDEVVEVCAGRIALDVELKEPGLEDGVLGVVGAKLGADEFVVTSFFPDVVAAAKRRRPDVRAGLLLAPGSGVNSVEALRRREAASADFIAPHFTLIDEEMASEAARHGIEIVVWTVNDEERLLRYLADARIAAVVTDDPELALSLRAR